MLLDLNFKVSNLWLRNFDAAWLCNIDTVFLRKLSVGGYMQTTYRDVCEAKLSSE